MTMTTVRGWFAWAQSSLVREVDRLWSEGDDPAYRANALAEECGEVNRAITKRRHAMHAPDGLCKGKTVEEWDEELRIELCQAFGVILDIAQREGIDLITGTEDTITILCAREKGS